MNDVPLRFLAKVNENMLSEDTRPEYTFKYIDITQVDGDGSVAVPTNFTSFGVAPSRARRLANPGSTVVSTVRTYLRAVGAVPDVGEPLVFSTGFAVLRPLQGDPRFFSYACRSDTFISEVVARSVGVSYPAIRPSELIDVRLPNPPLDEQRRIADFLDDRVARIDQIITARRQQLSLLEERIRLLPDELLLRVREPRVRVGHFVRRIEQGWSPQCDAVQAPPAEWGVLKVSAVQPGWFDASENKRLPDGQEPQPEYEIRPGDLLVSRANTPERVGFFSVVPSNVRPRLILCDKIMRIDISAAFEPSFVALVGQSRRTRDSFSLAGTGTSGSMVNIRGEDVRNMAVPLLSLERQRDLVNDWRQGSEALQSMKVELTSSVALHQEYKQSLITAAVTGELDVTTAGSGIPK